MLINLDSDRESFKFIEEAKPYLQSDLCNLILVQISDRFYEEFKRHNYVTPTSYLALIMTFKSLLKGKKNEIINMKTRYEMGLGKLEFASNQVK